MEFDIITSGQKLGISCVGIFFWGKKKEDPVFKSYIIRVYPLVKRLWHQPMFLAILISTDGNATNALSRIKSYSFWELEISRVNKIFTLGFFQCVGILFWTEKLTYGLGQPYDVWFREKKSLLVFGGNLLCRKNLLPKTNFWRG